MSSDRKQYTVTVEHTFYARDEEDARDTNFWVAELEDEGFITNVEEVTPRSLEAGQDAASTDRKRYTVTVEYTFYSRNEEDARDTNFWVAELEDEGFITNVEEITPRSLEAGQDAAASTDQKSGEAQS